MVSVTVKVGVRVRLRIVIGVKSRIRCSCISISRDVRSDQVFGPCSSNNPAKVRGMVSVCGRGKSEGESKM